MIRDNNTKFDYKNVKYSNIAEYLLQRYNIRSNFINNELTKTNYGYIIGVVGAIVFFITIFIIFFLRANGSELKMVMIFDAVLIIALFFLIRRKSNSSHDESINILSQLNVDNFFCYHCSKVILTENIQSLECPACETDNTFFEILNECKRCKTSLHYFECPHCKNIIDFISEPYDIDKIRKELHGQEISR